jgi:hypothetical protein
MKWLCNQRGSITEFAILVPLVVITMLTVLQLLLINTQRSESYAIADRIAFLAAAVSVPSALTEVALIKAEYSHIEQIQITRNDTKMQVKLIAEVNTLLPIPRISYQVIAASAIEP